MDKHQNKSEDEKQKEFEEQNKAAAASSEARRKERQREAERAKAAAEKAAADLLKAQEKFTADSIKVELNRNKLINQLSDQITAAQIANIEDEQEQIRTNKDRFYSKKQAN